MKIQGMEITSYGEEMINSIIDSLSVSLCNDFYPIKPEMGREVIMDYVIRKAKKEAIKMMNETKELVG